MPVVRLVVAQHHLQLILRDLAIAVPARSGAGRLLNLRVRCEADMKDLNVYGIVNFSRNKPGPISDWAYVRGS